MIAEYCDIIEKYLKRKVRFGLTERTNILNIMIEFKEKGKIINFTIDIYYIKCKYLKFDFNTLLREIKYLMENEFYTIIDGVLI